MKIAVLTDIHANWVAFQAVLEDMHAWKPDKVIIGGDLVNRGPRPREVLDYVLEQEREQGWIVVRGNHEDYVIKQANPSHPKSGPAFEVHKASFWTCQQLHCDVSVLQQMPFQRSLIGPDGQEVRAVHASMRGIRAGIYPETSDRDLAKLIEDREQAPPEVLVVGHTHRPLVRSLNGTLVVNAGSAGLPFDGDTRPSYAQLTFRGGKWKAAIQRVPYDLQAAERDFYESGYVEGAGPLVQLVLVELLYARSQLYNWSVRYQDRATRGEISMEESVRRRLEKLDLI